MYNHIIVRRLEGLFSNQFRGEEGVTVRVLTRFVHNLNRKGPFLAIIRRTIICIQYTEMSL